MAAAPGWRSPPPSYTGIPAGGAGGGGSGAVPIPWVVDPAPVSTWAGPAPTPPPLWQWRWTGGGVLARPLANPDTSRVWRSGVAPGGGSTPEARPRRSVARRRSGMACQTSTWMLVAGSHPSRAPATSRRSGGAGGSRREKAVAAGGRPGTRRCGRRRSRRPPSPRRRRRAIGGGGGCANGLAPTGGGGSGHPSVCVALLGAPFGAPPPRPPRCP